MEAERVATEGDDREIFEVLSRVQRRVLSGRCTRPLQEWLEVASAVVGAERGVVLALGLGGEGALETRARHGDAAIPGAVLEEARRVLCGGGPAGEGAWRVTSLVVDDAVGAVWCAPLDRAVPASLLACGADLLAHEHAVARRNGVARELEDERRALRSRLEAAETQLRDFGRLRLFEELLQVCEDLDELTEVVEHGLEQLFSDLTTAFYVVGPQGQALIRRDRLEGDAPDVVCMGECIAMRRGRIHRTGPDQALRCSHVGGDAGASAVCVPLIGQSETLGMLHVASPTTIDTARWATIETLAATAARRSAVAMANVRLSASLFDQTQRDKSTGLFNRRHLETRLAVMVRRAERTGVTSSLLLIDVSGYATIAEVFGMQAGALVLAELATILRGHARAEDLPCRLGRELFALAMPHADADVARGRAEALLAEIAAAHLSHQGRALGRLACCAGIAVAPGDGRDGRALIAAADRAMVHARSSGQSCVVVTELEGAEAPQGGRPDSFRRFGEFGMG